MSEKTYIVTRQVRLAVKANNRTDAIARSKRWQGETGIYSTNGTRIEWNGRSSFIWAKAQDRQL